VSPLQTAIWWIRQDVRLADNSTLASALAHSQVVVPLFILDPAVLESPYHQNAVKRKAFLFNGLRQLQADLHERGSRLIVRHGRPLDVLRALVAETGATAIFAAEDFSPYGRRRDGRIAQHLPLTLVHDLTVHHPASVLTAAGRPYTVFTPYSRAWRALPPPAARDLRPAPISLHPLPDLVSGALPAASNPAHFLPGESQARQALAAFAQGADAPIYGYGQGRNRLDWDGTSALSAYLRFGMISPREPVIAAQQAIAAAPDGVARASAEVWLNELIWREFYIGVLYHFPQVARQAFRPRLRDIAWSNDETAFAAWREGRTGYPVVDAAMRQLAATGWMHNRARMIAASFLVKDLLIDWRWGEGWFMQQLIDGDPAANNGGWQWAAGVGTDAAPYFRVFNPMLQAAKFDPYGAFVRAWLPELQHVPDEYVHEPCRMPAAVQRAARCTIGHDYPAPIVNHAVARARALAAYKRAGSLAAG